MLETFLKKINNDIMQKRYFQMTSFFVFVVLFISCKSQTVSIKTTSVYYKDFDIFKLKGTDTLKKIDKKQSVEVNYDNGIPIFIKYYRPERTITLLLEDSISVNNTPVYLYATSNLHGGQPGRRRVYSTHYEERKDLLYISLSDTIICKSHEVTKLDYYSYTIYLYIKDKNGRIFEFISGSDTKEDKELTKEALYLNWLKLLRSDYLKGERKPELIQGIPK